MFPVTGSTCTCTTTAPSTRGNDRAAASSSAATASATSGPAGRYHPDRTGTAPPGRAAAGTGWRFSQVSLCRAGTQISIRRSWSSAKYEPGGVSRRIGSYQAGRGLMAALYRTVRNSWV